MPRVTYRLLLGALAYAVALVLIALWPKRVDENLTIPYGYVLVEFTANVVLYAPLGALVLLMWPRWSGWYAVAAGFVVSAVFETLQAVWRPARTADPSDVLANTLGAALGAAIVMLVRRRSGR